jgi:tRNA U34 5-carboxymethylaminomethyl modifying enzyme MnmG/GidA
VFTAKAVVLTTGTFPRVRFMSAVAATPGGRAGDLAIQGLSGKSGGARIHRRPLEDGYLSAPRSSRTIAFDRLIEQQGDPNPTPFAFFGSQIRQSQVVLLHHVHHLRDP